MKQKKLGKKVQNWHRPLGPSQLRRRFLQHRYDDPEVTKRGRSLGYIVDVDDCWDCYDPYQPDWGGDTDDIYRYELDLFLKQILNPPPPLIPLEWVTDAPSDEDGEPMSSFARPRPSTGIEERLAAHVDKVVRISNSFPALKSQIVESIGDSRNVDMVKIVADRFKSLGFAKQVCLFAPFWVRSPRTWDKRGDSNLLDHLFVLHDVPGFLYSEWFRNPDVPRFKWLCWFILLGQGGSLKRAAELFRWRIPTRFQHYLRDAPSEASPTEACLFAEVNRLGGSEIDFRRVLRNPAFVIDPTELSAVESHSSFWHDTVRWLIAHGDAITDEESELILSWAMHEYTEAERAGAVTFSWKGRRVRTVLERSIEYRRQVERPWSCYKWRGHGWDWVVDEAPLGRWSFVELTSGEDLFREGQAMRHCVSSYAARCASGYSAIVSIRHNGTRCLTVEINPRTRQVVQARGPCNRQANTEEQRAVSLWMKTVVRPDRSNQTN